MKRVYRFMVSMASDVASVVCFFLFCTWQLWAILSGIVAASIGVGWFLSELLPHLFGPFNVAAAFMVGQIVIGGLVIGGLMLALLCVIAGWITATWKATK